MGEVDKLKTKDELLPYHQSIVRRLYDLAKEFDPFTYRDAGDNTRLMILAAKAEELAKLIISTKAPGGWLLMQKAWMNMRMVTGLEEDFGVTDFLVEKYQAA